MPEDFDKERQQLIDRFKESLRGNADDYFFDEDDLVEIFDYAGDLNNDYLRAEALMRAARFYPDSEAMRQRRITFYSDVLDPSMTEGLVEDSADDDSLLTQIALLRNSVSNKEQVQKRLEDFIRQYPPFDDEETIRFVQLANDFGLLDWIYKNYKKVAAHVGNEDVLLYELGYDFYDTYSQERDFDRAAELLSRLVEKMPFVADYWQILARSQYYSQHHRENYAESLDLALALDPTHRESLLFKSEIIENDNSASENKDTLREICDACPSEQMPLSLLLPVLTEEELQEEGVRRLHVFLETHPDSFFAISHLLAINPSEALRHFDDFEAASRITSSIGHVWAMVLYSLVYRQSKAVKGIISHVISSYKKRGEKIEPEFFTAAIESTFYLQDFDTMFKLIEAYSKAHETSPAIIVFLALAQAKLGNITEARNYAQIYLKMNLRTLSEGPGWHAMSRLVNLGAVHLMQDLLERTETLSEHPFDTEAYNPYGLWSPETPEIGANEFFTDDDDEPGHSSPSHEVF